MDAEAISRWQGLRRRPATIRARHALWGGALIVIGGLGCDASGGGPAPPMPDCAYGAGALVTETLPLTESQRAAIPIGHVIVAMKENRSFDHLLGRLAESGQPDAEAIPASFGNRDKSGALVTPHRLDTTCVNQDPGHQWAEMHRQVNHGAMDGFVVNGADTTGGDGHFVLGTYEADDLPFYYWLASTYALSDRHFASARSGTFPNRNFLLLGTADGVMCTGCGYPKPSTPTIFDSLDAAGVTWAAYSNGEPFDGTLAWGADHPGVHTFAEFQAALADGTLPQVAFVDGVGYVQDEHPTADVQIGEAWTRVVYQAVASSPLWPTAALVWTYDEGGGFGDHLPPPEHACIARPGNPADTAFFELGVRIPLAVVSPYARPHYVSHVVHDHTAITRFIEAVFNLPALTARDANSDALLDMFDFSAPSLLAPPAPPPAGTGGCHGNIVLATDQPTYPSLPSTAIQVMFSGVPTPGARDRIGAYRYGDVPSENNRQEPVAWGYIGGQGHTAAGAPANGAVVLDAASVAPGASWPLPAGLWIVYYLPALANGSDGHSPSASIDFEMAP